MAPVSFAQRDGFIWLDGTFVPWATAQTHVLTHALHYGSAVFEGERVYQGTVFKLKQHSSRLIRRGYSRTSQSECYPRRLRTNRGVAGPRGHGNCDTRVRHPHRDRVLVMAVVLDSREKNAGAAIGDRAVEAAGAQHSPDSQQSIRPLHDRIVSKGLCSAQRK